MTTKRFPTGKIALNLILFFICYFLSSSLFAQYHQENITIKTFPEVSVIASVPIRQHKFVVDVDIVNPGYYRIFPRIRYSTGQMDESFYLTVLLPADPQSGIRPISVPADNNAGMYKVVQDIDGDTLQFKDAGSYFFEQGTNTVVMHHYAAIADSFPDFINGDIFSGKPESVHMVDSLKIIAEPVFAGPDDAVKSDIFEDKDNDGTISPGDIVLYSINIKNSGTGIAHDVVFNDSIPQNTSYVSGSATTSKGVIQNTSPVLTIDIGTIAPLESEIITILFQVEVTSASLLIENQGVINSYEIEQHLTDDPDTDEEDDKTKTLHPYFKGDTDVLKTDKYFDTDEDGKISIGDDITYTITIKNSGSKAATNIVFSDSIPSNTTYVTGSAATSKGEIISTSPIMVVNIDSIAAYSSETVTIVFKVVLSADVNEIKNQGYVDSEETLQHPTDDPDTSEEDDETITRLPSFSLVSDVLKKQSFQDLDDSGTLSNGDLISYTVTIKNSGGGAAINVVFTDTIPTNTTYVTGSATTSKGSIETTSPVLKVNIGKIAANGSETVTISFQVRLAASVEEIRNQGFIDCEKISPHPTDDPDTPEEDDETITRAPSFKGNNDVLKTDVFIDTDQNSLISAGDTISYTITVNNSGAGTANNVVLTDTIPQNTTYIQGSASTSKGTIASTSPVLLVAIGSIKANSSEIITIKYKVLVTASVEQIENQGFVDSDETKSHPTDDPDTPDEDDPTKTKIPTFTGKTDVLKTDSFRDVDGSGTITPGDSIFYTITIKNSGSGIASNVAFTDTIPDHTILVNGSVTTTKGTIISTVPVLQIEIGTIAEKEQETITIKYAVVVIDAVNKIENQGYVTSPKTIPEPTDDPDTPEGDDETITTPPSIEVFKQDVFQDVNDDGVISVGDLISYTLTVINGGSGTGHNVVLTDTIPQNTEYVSGTASSTQGTIESFSPVLKVNIGIMAPNDTVTINYRVSVTTSTNQIENQGFINSDETPTKPSDDPDTQDEDDKTITRAPSFKLKSDVTKRDLFVDADSSGNFSPGDTVSYTIILKNSGTGTANNVTFTDSLPSNTSLADGSVFTSKGTVVTTSPALQVNIGSIAGNESELITIKFKVVLTASVDEIVNQGWINSDETQLHPTDDPDTDEEDDPTKTAPPNFNGTNDVLKNDLFRDADGSGTITAGDTIIYTISITNSGAGTAKNVVFTDTMPEHTAFVSGSASTTKGTIEFTDPVLQVNIGTIAPNSTEIVTINFNVVVTEAATQISNQGLISGDETIDEPTDDPDTPADDDETITTPPTIELFKRDAYQDINGDGIISIGDVISYTLTVINSGAGYGHNVVLNDTIPLNTEYVTGTVSTTQGTIESTSPVLKVNIGTMASNDTVTIKYRVSVTTSTNQIENQGWLNSDEAPTEPSDDPDTPQEDDKTITQSASFNLKSDVTKRDLFVDADSSGNLSPGDTVAYFITLKNSGTGVANNVTFTDSLPQNTSFVENSASTSKGTITATSPVLKVNIGTIAANESEIVTITFKVVLTASVDEIENQGWIDSDETKTHPTDDPDTDEEDDPTKTLPPNFKGKNDVLKDDLFRDADGSGTITAGDTIIYTITMKNSGAGTARNVIFTDTMPEHTSYVPGSASTTKGTIVSTDPVLQVNIGTIAAKSAETVTISFKVTITEAADQISNQGLINGDETIPESTDDPDTPKDDDETITSSPGFNGSTDVLKSAVIQDVDSSYTISTGDIITYTITFQNSGKGVANDVVFTDTIPNFTNYVNGSATTTKGEIVSTSPIVRINVGTIAPNKSETVTITFQVSVTGNVEQIINQGFIESRETPTEPTDDPDTPEEDDETIIDNSDFWTDISVYQFAVTDSFDIGVTDSDTIKYSDEEETYTIYIKVKNEGTVTAKDVRLTNFLPDSIKVSNIVPAGISSSDSLTWQFSRLEKGDEKIFHFDATIPDIMPFGRTYLINKVTASASNEDPSKLSNNSSVDTVFCDVSEASPFKPQIEAIPVTIDVTDSVTIRVLVPQDTKSWDLVVLFPNEQTDSTYADDYISTSVLTPDVWYDIDQMYKPIKMITTEKQETLIFEIISYDKRDRKASAQTTVTVVSSNYLVLDRNVYRPDSETSLGIKFKLSSQRNAKLDLYDVAGRHITKITEDIYDGGWNLYNWSGMTEQGLKVGSGVYIVTLRSAEFKDYKKFILIR